jgi:hypothetical protein
MGFQTMDPTNTGLVIGVGSTTLDNGTVLPGVTVATGQAAVNATTSPSAGLSLANPVVLIVLAVLAFVVFKD